MGKISKAIRLKLQELRIDDVFKEKILKYKEVLSNDETKKSELNRKTEEDKSLENKIESKEEKHNKNLNKSDLSENNEIFALLNMQNDLNQSEQHFENKTETVFNDIPNNSIKENNNFMVPNQNYEHHNLNIEDAINEGMKNLQNDTIEKNKLLHRTYKINRDKLKEIKVFEQVFQEIKLEEESTKVAKSIKINETMMQYFEWYYPNDGSLWNKIKVNAKELSNIGITALWLPPACKANQGIYDVGYGIYDLFDLGEFDQKGSVRTKYGTKEEYLMAIEEAHKNNIKIYGDVVFNHKAGADESEIVAARPVASNNRNEYIGEKRNIGSHTVFNFPGRGTKYSKYQWSAKDFNGVDFDDITKENGIFKFVGKDWERDVDSENGNYDFLMFADLDMDSPNVIKELNKWGKWYLEQTKVDGFRLDAIKHIKFDFFYEWLKNLRKQSSKELFAVGEYWTHDVNKMNYYMDKCKNCMSLFDAPLHFNFHNASNSFGNFDMRTLTDNTFLKINPDKAVTFVDNHDTQLGQSLESWVQPWFKLLAYTFILTRKEGYPCIFYGDYYGIPEKNFHGIKENLDIILKVRKKYAYGTQHDYIDDKSIIGWTREGDNEHDNSGLAAVITVNCGGKKRMYVGHNHKGEIWRDVTNQINKRVIIDKDGFGVFAVLDGSYSIWLKHK